MFLRTYACVATLLLAASPLLAQTLALTPTTIASTSGARAIATADFDRNGWADVAHANFGGNTVTVLLNRGGTFAKHGDIAVGNGPFDMPSISRSA
jgi:hypothetical protein